MVLILIGVLLLLSLFGVAKGRKKGVKPGVGAKPVTKVDTTAGVSETVVVDVDSSESRPSPVAIQERNGNGDAQGGGEEVVEQTRPVDLDLGLETPDVRYTSDGTALEKEGRDGTERSVVDGAADDEPSKKLETQAHSTGQVTTVKTTVPIIPTTITTKAPTPITKHIFAPSQPHSPHRPPPLATDPHPRTNTTFSPSRKPDTKPRPMSTPPPPSPPPLTPRPHLVLTSTSLGPISLHTPFHTLLSLLAPLGPTHLLYSPHRNTGFWIHLPAPRIGIFIHGTSHTVQRIECYDPSAVAIEYQGQMVCGDRVVPTFGGLYRVLGPVYPGGLKSTSHDSCTTSTTSTNITTASQNGEEAPVPVYVLRYPSLTLEFPVPEESGCDITELPLRFRDGSSPVLSRLVVEDNQKQVKSEMDKHVWVTVVLGRGVYFDGTGGSVLVGDDLQSVIGVLGRPDGWVDKPQTQSVMGYGSEYIWNYFSLGIDLVISAHHVRKIVLHTDVEGVVGWGIYQRCFFRVVAPSTVIPTSTTPSTGQQTTAPSTVQQTQPVLFTYTSTLASLLLQSKSKSTHGCVMRVSEKPLTHNRGGMHPFGSTYFYGVCVCGKTSASGNGTGNGSGGGNGNGGGEDGGMTHRCVVEFTKEGFLVSLVMY
ncbi:hypothetical protein BC832DRAFT_563366 [Gaertneriomyces semiglobifer]|nr:hypothetical protein BC832DRAFT_563366 [Gaertneriomyces semiglobifer]